MVEWRGARGTRAYDGRKKAVEVQGYYRRRIRTQGQQGCNAFDPANREKGKNILPLGSGPKKSLCYLVFLTPKRYICGLNFGHN